MVKCYQHVTDSVRADVASQVGGLIWAAQSEGTADATITVRRGSLIVIPPLVEDGLLKHEGDDIDLAELEAALLDLREAIAAPSNGTEGDAK